MAIKSKVSSLLRKLHLLAFAEQLRFIIHRLRFRKANKSFKKTHPLIIFPPDYLVYETYKLNLKEYLHDGQATAAEIVKIVSKYFTLSAPGIKILDWGCGPGRIVRHLPVLAPQAIIYATDYNKEYVKWCRDNLKLIHCSFNSIHPPMDYEDSSFDVVIGISIFTHLSRQNHIAWINELKRIIRPGGIAYITTQGQSYHSKLLVSEQLKFDNGELVTRENILEGNRLFSAFQPPEFMKQLITDKFEIGEFISSASTVGSSAQDTWVLKRIF